MKPEKEVIHQQDKEEESKQQEGSSKMVPVVCAVGPALNDRVNLVTS